MSPSEILEEGIDELISQSQTAGDSEHRTGEKREYVIRFCWYSILEKFF